MPPKDVFSLSYIAYEQKQAEKQQQFKRDVERGKNALTQKRQNRIQ